MENQNFEVVVVGAGVMGSTTAYYLSKLYGSKVLLLEQFDFLHRRGSSHGDSRIIRPTYPKDFYTFLMKRSYELWLEAEKESSTNVFVKTGGLDFATSTNPDLLSLISAVEKHDIPHEVLTPAQVSEKFPTIQLPENYTAVYAPDSGVLKATKAVSMFQKLAEKNGCRLEDNVKIDQIIAHHQLKSESNAASDSKFDFEFEIKTQTHGNFTAKKLVVTAGAWTQKVLDKITINKTKVKEGNENKDEIEFNLDLKLPLQPIQATAVYWEVETPSAFSGLNQTFPVFIAYENDMIYGMPALEFPNLIKVSPHVGPNTDPDERTFRPGTKDIDEDVGPFVHSTFKGIAPKPSLVESCMYTMTPDSDFIIDKIKKHGIQGLFVGCGFSGHGFKLAPIVGTMLTGLVVDGKNPFEYADKQFLISRF